MECAFFTCNKFSNVWFLKLAFNEKVEFHLSVDVAFKQENENVHTASFEYTPKNRALEKQNSRHYTHMIASFVHFPLNIVVKTLVPLTLIAFSVFFQLVP